MITTAKLVTAYYGKDHPILTSPDRGTTDGTPKLSLTLPRFTISPGKKGRHAVAIRATETSTGETDNMIDVDDRQPLYVCIFRTQENQKNQEKGHISALFALFPVCI